MSEQQERRKFEDDVRRVAEAIWGLKPGEVQPAHYSSDPIIRELDGLARLRDVTHLLMVTVSRKLEKTKSDVKKLNAAERIERKGGVAIQKWFITCHQLEAEHLAFCRENNVSAITLSDFRNRFFHGRDYVQKRRNSAFGSARNPLDDSISIPEDEYVPLPLRVVATQDGTLDSFLTWDLEALCGQLEAGTTVVLLGQFGAGKSLTVREIFLRLQRRYLSGQFGRAPIAISLREHWGARYADEILERHAKEIGFTPREDLLVAWRAGMSVLLLDGFDEVATQVVARAADRNFMRESRAQALEATRKLLSETPAGTGCLITGRDHYFDGLSELSFALGLRQRQFFVVELGEFSEDSADEYLRRKGSSRRLPDWVPRKPLILGYLARRELLGEVVNIDGGRGFGHAWQEFLRLICEREAAYGRGIMEPGALQALLERLAWDVRATSSGTGPISERDLAEAYRSETGLSAGEGVLMQLQRLPGLTPRDQDPGSRAFVDQDMLSALQGSALARFVMEGKTPGSGRNSICALPQKALSYASHRLTSASINTGTLIVTGRRATDDERNRRLSNQLLADCVATALEMTVDNDSLECYGANVSEGIFSSISLEERAVFNLTLRDCLIEELSAGPAASDSNLRLLHCSIEKVRGATSEAGLPTTMLDACVVEEFDAMGTNAAIVRSNLPDQIKVLLTVLRKLYMQAGGGRKLASLRRGLPPGRLQACVTAVVSVLEQHEFIWITNEIAHPVRRHSARVREILANPGLSKDPVYQALLPS